MQQPILTPQQQEPCMECVLTTMGVCKWHDTNIKKSFVPYTFTTTTRVYTKQECLQEIAILTRQLLKLKWYQFKQKQYTKGELRIWMRDYDNILRAE